MIFSSFSWPIWWREIWQFAAVNSYIQLVSWVFVRSSIPFAVRNATRENETDTEQYAIELSYVAALMGSLLAIFVGIRRSKIFLCITCVYTLVALLFLIVSVQNDGAWVFDGSDAFVVCLVVFLRFVDGYLSPLIYQNVARRYPNRAREMNQWLGATAAISAFVGVWITYALVQVHVVR